MGRAATCRKSSRHDPNVSLASDRCLPDLRRGAAPAQVDATRGGDAARRRRLRRLGRPRPSGPKTFCPRARPPPRFSRTCAPRWWTGARVPAAADTRTPRGSPRSRPRSRRWAPCPRMAAPEPDAIADRRASLEDQAGAGARPADQRQRGLHPRRRADRRDRRIAARPSAAAASATRPQPHEPGELGHGAGRAARSGRHDPEPDLEPRRRPGAPG
jgi:hypothetical protein